MTYQEHIEALAKEMGVVIEQRPGQSGMMFVEEKPPRIEIATFDDKEYSFAGWLTYPAEIQTKYFAALHELGHCHYGHTQGRPPHGDKRFYFTNGVLRSEAQAWDFAIEHCMDRIKPQTAKFALRCFNSYRNDAKRLGRKYTTLGNGNRHYVAFQYDSPYGEDVLDVLARLSYIEQSFDYRIKTFTDINGPDKSNSLSVL